MRACELGDDVYDMIVLIIHVFLCFLGGCKVACPPADGGLDAAGGPENKCIYFKTLIEINLTMNIFLIKNVTA